MPRHRLPGAPGQVGKMLLNQKMQIMHFFFIFVLLALCFLMADQQKNIQKANLLSVLHGKLVSLFIIYFYIFMI